MTASENITRAEAQDRSSLLSVQSYDVVLDVTSDGPTFSTVTTATFACNQPGATSWIDLIAPVVHSVVLNGVDLDVAIRRLRGRASPCPDLAAENAVVITADGAFMNTGEGLHRFVDPVDKETYLYTQFESADARRMYACFEQPDLKAEFRLTVTAPSHWRSSATPPAPSPTVHGDGTATWAFDADPPPLDVHHRPRRRPVPPRQRLVLRRRTARTRSDVYCRESLAKYLDPEEILTVTKQGFEYFEEQFGVAYPFAKYDQLFVPEFNAGAMENAGCVTILEDYVFRSRVTDAAYEQRANTILHELAHMWFGDLVTMTWWDDLWLNESFAEWAAHWCERQRHPLHRRVDDVLQPAQGLGLPAGPAPLDAPDRRRHGRPRRRPGELRRHHLREGRLGAAAARGVGRRGGVPRRRARLLRQARVGQHRAAATCSPSSRSPAAATSPSGPGSGCRPAA